MSVKQITKVFADTSITSNQKLIMLALADYAGDEGVAYPLIATLEKKCSLPKRTIMNNIKSLKEHGLLISRIRARKSGGRSSSKYLIYPHDNWTKLDEETREYFAEEYSQSVDLAPMTQSADLALNPPSQSVDLALCLYKNEPSLRIEPSLLYIFEEFWKSYGRKGSKKDSLTQWNKMSDDERCMAVEKLPAYLACKRVKEGYKRDCERWLSKKLWETDWEQEVDEQTKRRMADKVPAPF